MKDDNIMKPILFMLCGVPASGKSTFVNKMLGTVISTDAFIYSTDNYIEEVAASTNTTYNQVFNDKVTYKQALNFANMGLISAIDRRVDVIWDKTNLAPKSRKDKLLNFSQVYFKTAVNFDIPERTEWERRLNSRPGKVIPSFILDGMRNSYVPASLSEGFDRIISSGPQS